MAQLKDLLVLGPSRFIGDVFANNLQAFRITDHLIPIENETYDLGSSSLRWNNIYAKNTYADAQTLQELVLQKQTSASNAYNASNPRITFKNVDGSQNAQLIYTDYDSITSPASQTLAPASLTLVGNQDNVQFVTPRLRVGGYINNTYAFSAATAIVNSWIRTVGSAGWLSESYGGGWYMSDTTWIRSYGSKSIYQNTGTLRTDGTFQIGDSGKYVQLSSSGFKFGDTAAASANNLMTLNGHMLINGSYNTTNSYSEGIRINRSTNGWCGITLGGTQGTTSGTGQGVWIVTTYSTPADATTAAGSLTASKFYISHNGSSAATTRIEGLWSSTASNPQGFAIYPRVGIAGSPNNSYPLYVNGSSYLKGNVYTEGYLKLGSSAQADTTAPQNKGIYVHDLRNITSLPNSFGANNVQFYFDSGVNDTGRSTPWSTLMHVNGWTAGNYAAHQLSFNADNTAQTSEAFDGNLYHRSGITSWKPWRTILDSHNMMKEIEIGGMNILPETQYLDNWNGTKTWTTDAPFTWCAVRSAVSPASDSSTSYVDLSRNSIFTPEPNTYYTLSFWAKASTNSVKIHSYFYSSITKEGYNSQGKITSATDGNIVTTLSTAWTHYWVTWKTNDSINNAANVIIARVMRDEHPGVTVYYALPKMEKGKMHSDWSPNPGDAIHVFGRSVMTGSGAHLASSGGGYHADNNSIVLHGNATNGSSGIVFLSEKGLATNINSGTDRAFIQYHPYGVTAAAEGTAPTLASSGEAGRLVIGIGNDSTDHIWLQAPDSLGIKHQIGANSYTIADTNNVSWSAWTAGTTAGPKANISFAGVTKTSDAIPSAASGASGIVTTGAQTMDGLKTFTGGITAGTTSANGIGIAQTGGTGLGLSLYGGHQTSTPQYGVAFATTGNLGKFGDVQGDWATYFTMNIANQRGWIWKQYNTTAESGMAGSLSSRGVATFKSLAAKTGFISYPEGGQYTTSTSSVSGMLHIRMPGYKKNIMMSFTVRVYTYSGNTITEASYRIHGYLYGDSGWYSGDSYAYSEGYGANANLTVRYGYDGTAAAITIGETNTVWSYPQVVITDVVYGFGRTVSEVAYGWQTTFTTSNPLTSTATTVTNPLGNKTGRFNDILNLYRESATTTDAPAGIYFNVKDTTTNSQTGSTIYVYNDHASSTCGNNMVINPGGHLVLGGGEGASALYGAKKATWAGNGGENIFMVADGSINIEANSSTIANRIGFQVTTDGHIIPVKAEAANNNAQNIGASDNRWAKLYIGDADSYGSSTKPIWWLNGAPAAIGYELKSTLNSGTTNTLAFYSDTNTVSSVLETDRFINFPSHYYTYLYNNTAHNYIHFFPSSGGGSSAVTTHFRTWNGTAYVELTLVGGGAMTWNGSSFSVPSGTIWAGTDGNTTAERQVGVRSGAGSMYMYSQAATGGSRGIYLLAHGTGSAKSVFSVDTNNNVTFNGALSGNASSASTVYSAAYVPSSYHYLEFQATPGASSSGNATLRHHNSLRVKSNVSTENSGTQWTELFIGNATASGTAGNSQGWLALYSSSAAMTQIASQSTGQSNYFYIPNYSGNGYAVTVSSGSAEGSNTQPVYIAANGRATKLTYTANRLYYSASTSSFEATGHYANSTKIAINSTTEPSYNLYVGGNSYINSTLQVNGTITGNSTIQGKGKIVANANNIIDTGARVELNPTGAIDLYSAGNPEINFHTENVTTANAQVIVEEDCIKFVFN